MYICMYELTACIHIYIYICICTYIYLCACVRACVCLCAHACAHAHTVCVRLRLHLFRLMVYYSAPRVRVRYIPPGTGCPRGQRQVWRNAHVGYQRPAGVPTPVQAGKGQLCNCFDEGETTTNKCVLCGPGGFGKSTLTRNFVAECAAGGPLDTLSLVLVMLASTLEYDYLGLHELPEAYEDGGSAADRLARPAQSAVRKVHALLGSPTWLGTMARHPRQPTGSRSDRNCKS